MTTSGTFKGANNRRLSLMPLQEPPAACIEQLGDACSSVTESGNEGARVERRLAAIMSGDVVAYTRLMAEDEEATVGRLRTSRESIGALIERHRGRVVDFTGDNFLAEFCSVVNAVTCAFGVQERCRSANADLPPGRRMEFRLGLHLAEVWVEEGQLYGTGVNIAARLESLADPGGICASAAVVHEIASRVAAECEDMGERSVKNIPQPIRVFRLRTSTGQRTTATDARGPRQRRTRRAAILGLFALLMPLGAVAFSAIAPDVPWLRAQPVSPSAIAVLPFADLSAAQDQRYFPEGLVEQLTHALVNVCGLRVAARTSALAVTTEEGSIGKSGTLTRVTVQANRVADGYHLWSKTYDYEGTDGLAIEDEIARSVAEILTTQSGGERVGVDSCGPDNELRSPAVRTTGRSDTRIAITNPDAG